jgi:hypothetical protein
MTAHTPERERPAHHSRAHHLVTLVIHGEPVPRELAQAVRDENEQTLKALKRCLAYFEKIRFSGDNPHNDSDSPIMSECRAAIRAAEGGE